MLGVLKMTCTREEKREKRSVSNGTFSESNNARIIFVLFFVSIDINKMPFDTQMSYLLTSESTGRLETAPSTHSLSISLAGPLDRDVCV